MFETILIVFAIVLITFLVSHVTISILVGASSDFNRAKSCVECCFKIDNLCSHILWFWLIGRVMVSHPKFSRICPFCYDKTITDKNAAEKDLIKRYLIRFALLILGGIPAFFAWLWAFTKIKGE